MENTITHVLGRRIVLERQKRFSFETSERIYLKSRSLYRNHPSSSDHIEKIHRTREQLANVKQQLDHEIELLKEVRNSSNNRKDERLMTWDERFRANRPRAGVLVANKQHGPARDLCASPGDLKKTAFKGDLKKPAFKEVNLPSQGLPPKELISRKPPPRWQPRELAPRGLPPREIPPKDFTQGKLHLKRIPSRGLSPRGIPPKNFTQGKLQSKLHHHPSRDLPPRAIPSKDFTQRKPQPKRIPLKELPPKEPPRKALITRKPPPKSSTQKELEPGKIPPKEITTRKPKSKDESIPKDKSLSKDEPIPKLDPLLKVEPIPKEESIPTEKPIEKPMQGELRCVDSTPENLAARISGGCCHCCCYPIHSICRPPCQGGNRTTNCCCNIAFNRGIQHGIPFCTAQRRVTDLNTQETFRNRYIGTSPPRRSVGQQCSSRLGKSPTSLRESSKEKNKEQFREKEKEPIREKNIEPFRDGRTSKNEKIIKGRKEYKPPVSFKRDKPTVSSIREKPKVCAPKKEITKLNAVPPKPSPTKEQPFGGNERLHEKYLNMYYQENSKEDLQEGVWTVPTYTRLPPKNVKPTESPVNPIHWENSIKGKAQLNFKEGQRVSIPKESNQPIESRAYSQHQKSAKCQDKDRPALRQETRQFTKECVVVREVPTNVNRERSPLPRESDSEGTGYASLPVKRQSNPPPTRQPGSTTTETRRWQETSSRTYALSSTEKSNQDRQSNLSRGTRSPRMPQSTTTNSHRQSNPSPISSRRAQTPLSESSYETRILNPHYQSKDHRGNYSSQEGSDEPTDNKSIEESFSISSHKTSESHDSLHNESQHVCFQLPKDFKDSVTSEEEEPEAGFHRIRNDSPSRQSKARNLYQGDDSEYSRLFKTGDTHKYSSDEGSAFGECLSVLSGKSYRSCNESPRVSLRTTKSRDLKNSLTSEEEETDKAFPRIGNDSPYRQSKARNLNEDNQYSSQDNSSYTDDIQSRFDGYETARSIDAKKQHYLPSDRSSSPHKSCDNELPFVKTVCEKRTRTVTFKDEQGELKKLRQEEEHCNSHIDWEQALKYRQAKTPIPNDNYTFRSSSSAEHTCLESSGSEDEADYDSCRETASCKEEPNYPPPFKACPCMYETYRQLAAMCRSRKSPNYR